MDNFYYLTIQQNHYVYISAAFIFSLAYNIVREFLTYSELLRKQFQTIKISWFSFGVSPQNYSNFACRVSLANVLIGENC